MGLNTENIRNFLFALDETEEYSVRFFCYDNPQFLPLHNEFKTNAPREIFFERFIQYITQKKLVIVFLNWAKKRLTVKYRSYEPYMTVKKIPIAVIAMNQAQAKELILDPKHHFEGYSKDYKEWIEFWGELEKKAEEVFNELNQFTPDTLVARYGEVEDEISNYIERWRPLITRSETIQKIIDKAFQDYSNAHQDDPREADYISSWLLDSGDYEAAIDMLKNQKGILVVDAISMYHRDLKGKINDPLHLFDPLKGISTIVISPLKQNAFKINKLLEENIYLRNLSRLFSRFENCIDMPEYQFGISDVRHFSRCLYTILHHEPDKSTIQRVLPPNKLSSSSFKTQSMGVSSFVTARTR